MNTQQARERVAETFPQQFNRGKFLEFTRNLLNKFDESKAAQWNATYVKDAFKPHVARFERLGTYTSPDDDKLDVLVVHLTNESKLERARTAIRNFVADHLKTRDEKDAALVAFVSPTERQWRFSYVKMEYAAVETESGKVGVETRLTPARRYSYIVGEGESCHTAQTRFLALLQDTENFPTLAQLEDAFSVEAVTKEFFNQYAELFSDIDAALQKLAAKDPVIGKEFKAKNLSTVDFAKKLMGQIVFLYFLQKKGWLGVAKGQDWGTGPHDFLRRLVSSSPLPSDGRGVRGEGRADVNIFNDVLEPLFYDTLATDRGHEAWCKIFKCRIPFLNGGLFEPLRDYDWRKTEILLPNKLFTNTECNDAGDEGTGVLDVFDRYNFTVNEAEPLEKEVAIDPEMLGKVFENLIEENRRKGLGSFYTPREIVHYMCQESLINYLDTAVNSEMGSAPASGAAVDASSTASSARRASAEGLREGAQTDTRGACAPRIPRADLETFIHLGDQISHYEAVEARYAIKMPKSIEQHARLIDEKLADITVCDPAVGSGAYPVGMMTEIVRARSALNPYFAPAPSAPSDPSESARTPYHFKRHAIQNCLYGVDIDPGAVEIAKLRLWLSLVVDEEETTQIKPLPNLHFKIVVGNALQRVEKTLFNEKLFKGLEELKTKYFDETDRVKKDALKHDIEGLIHELTEGKESFDFEIYFSEVFHLKPGFDVIIMNPPYGAALSESEKNYLKTRFEHIAERIRNTYLYFMGLAYEIGKQDSVTCLIIPNEFLFQIYMTKARKFFVTDARMLFAVNVGEEVFEAIVPTAIVAFQKRRERSYPIPVADLRECSLQDLPRRLDVHSFSQSSNEIILKTPNAMFSFDLERTNLVTKLTSQFPHFENFCEDVANGICTSCDEVYIVSERVAKSEGFESEFLKPCIRGGQMNRFYCPASTHECVLYITDDFEPKRAKNIFRYLSEHKKLLIQKSVEKKQGNRDWHVLFRARYPGLFIKPKIMIRQTADRIIAAIDNAVGYHCINSVNVATLKQEHVGQIQYFVGLLNSSLLNFYYREISQEAGRVLAEVKPQRIRALPIPNTNEKLRSAIVERVDKILAAKQRDAGADMSGLEREIDELVYALYGLTPEEKALVQAAAK